MSTSSRPVSWGVRTDVGRVRAINQDSVHAEPTLFVVADGMGGHQGGEVASSVAIEAMASSDLDAESVEALVQRVKQANAAILEQAERDESLAGMGTTLCALALLDPDWRGGTRLGLVNVGDSRIYRYADGELQQITHDHSLVAELVRDGHLSDDEAAIHPQRNIVTRALGIVDEVEVDSWELLGRRDERYVLCSDGLVNEVSDAQIAATMRRLDDPAEVVDELVRLANESGARDNVSVVVVRIDTGEEGPADELPDPPGRTAPAASAAGSSVFPIGRASADEQGQTSREGTSAFGGPDDVDERFGDVVWAERDANARFRRRVRVRAIVSTIVVVLIILAALVVTGLYARNNYYVSFEGDQVVIFQGRPGGVLWFDPTVEMPTAFLRSDLTDAIALEIDAIPEFGTLAEAEDYVDDLDTRLDGFSS